MTQDETADEEDMEGEIEQEEGPSSSKKRRRVEDIEDVASSSKK